MLLTKGILKYYPLEGEENNQGWLILQCDRDISLYYCWFIQKKFGIKLQQPRLGSHITIVRGEVLSHLERWNAYQGHTIEFHYSNEVKSNSKHWWLDVHSHCLMSIRQELGLNPQPQYNFHLTIGVFLWQRRGWVKGFKIQWVGLGDRISYPNSVVGVAPPGAKLRGCMHNL